MSAMQSKGEGKDLELILILFAELQRRGSNS
jgi:hypothetical protein